MESKVRTVCVEVPTDVFEMTVAGHEILGRVWTW